MIDRHGEAILSDLLLYYGVDLRELFSDAGALSPRYVLALILHLPTDGAFFASRRGGQEYRGWDVDRYALVSLVNAQRANNYILTLVNRDPKRRKPDPPEPFPVPGEERESGPKPGSFAAIAAGMFAAQKRRKELIGG